jgi:hypothetical protein
MQKFMQNQKTVTDKWTDEGTDMVSKNERSVTASHRTAKGKGKIHPASAIKA